MASPAQSPVESRENTSSKDTNEVELTNEALAGIRTELDDELHPISYGKLLDTVSEILVP